MQVKQRGVRLSTDRATCLVEGYYQMAMSLYWQRGIYFIEYEDVFGKTRLKQISEEEAKKIQGKIE